MYTVCITLTLALAISCIYGHPEDMEYDDHDSPEVPADWRDRIDEKVLPERLSERIIGPSLLDDIIYANDQMMYENIARHSPFIAGGECRSTTVIRSPVTLWPVRNKSIPYRIDTAFYAQDRFLIKSVLKDIEEQTRRCITFSEQHVQNETNFVLFQPADGCYSNVGMQSGFQPNVIGLNRSKCMEPGLILHEVMHTLGFFHEQSRPDRDKHVEVRFQRVRQAFCQNFWTIKNMKTYGIQYDLESIMHYGPCDFAKSTECGASTETVIAFKPGEPETRYKMGQRRQLSTGDISKLLTAYNCSNREPVSPEPVAEPVSDFPVFSTAPITTHQCRSQFNSNCGSTYTTVDNCTVYNTLMIRCDFEVTEEQLDTMVQTMALPPRRAMQVFLWDQLISAFTFNPVKLQIIELGISYCSFRRTTAKLSELKFTNLIYVRFSYCNDLVIRKTDFKYSDKLRVVFFYLATIQTLEQGTFTDLVHLAVLALDAGMSRLVSFDDKTQKNIERIHCGCSFSWMRSWWQNNRILKKQVAKSEIYQYPFYNPPYAKEEIYLPINCTAIPHNPRSINFSQTSFSINEPICSMNESRAGTADDFPEFSMEPMRPKQCALQFSENCGSSYATVNNCTKDQSLEIRCSAATRAAELQRMAFEMSKPPVRAVRLALPDGDYLDYFIFRIIRRQVIEFFVWNCTASRITHKLYTLDFVNLLEFGVSRCDSLVVHKNDFSTSAKLKIISFYNTNIRFLEKNSFDYLPQLSLLSLEAGVSELTTLTRRMRDYLDKLHCDCQYAWFRSWLVENDVLLLNTGAGAIFNIESVLRNRARTKEEVRLPIDCAVRPLPANPRFLNYNQTEFSLNAPQCTDGNETEIVSNITMHHTEYSGESMSLDQCRLQFTENCASEITTVDDCNRFRVLDIRCSSRASSYDIGTMVLAMGRPPIRPKRLWFADERWTSLPEKTFEPIQSQVTSVFLWNCVDKRTTATLAKFGLFTILQVQFRNCTGIIVERSDFARLTEIKVLIFDNTTISAIERETFSELSELRLLSLENGLAPLLSSSRLVSKYVSRLHCSCEYAWLRKWWHDNRDLMHQAQEYEIFYVFNADMNSGYSKDEVYLPVDCGKNESTPDMILVNFTQEEFSVNEIKCTY